MPTREELIQLLKAVFGEKGKWSLLSASLVLGPLWALSIKSQQHPPQGGSQPQVPIESPEEFNALVPGSRP